MRDLTRGSIPRHIVAMAVPIAVGILVQTLYYLVDLYFVSRLGGVALAGVSAAGNVMFLVLALTQMLSVGVVATVSHAVGAEDHDGANQVFHQGLMLALILATLVLGGGYLGLGKLYSQSVGADVETAVAGTTYLYWFLPSLALQFVATAMGAALQGTGIVKPTMVVQVLGVLVNVILTPILVGGWLTGKSMGVAGAGLASTLAAAAGAIMMAFYFVRLEHYIRFDAAQLRPRFNILRRMLGIGMPAGGEFALLFVYMAVIYSVIGIFGASAQAGFGVGSRVMQAVFLPAMAVAFAIPAIAGQNFGAQNAGRVRETFRAAVLFNVVFMGLLTLICQWNADGMVRAFSSDAQVLQVAALFMTVISWNFIASGIIFTCSGMFQALGNTLPSLAANATRLVTFVVPVFWISTRPDFEIVHVWYLSVATMTFQMLVCLALLRWQFRRRLRFDAVSAVA